MVEQLIKAPVGPLSKKSNSIGMGPFKMSSCSSCVGLLGAAETYCLWTRMGPLQLPIKVAYDLEWAHCDCREVLLIILYGPITDYEKC
jgi:hypothetical protein